MAKKIFDNRKIEHEQWLKNRKLGLGGSDISAIVGLNPWKSALSVYLDKTSQELREIPDNERMRIGRDLENYVAKRFEEATGKKVRRQNFTLQHEKYPFMLANVDREVVGENAVLECKTTSSYGSKNWLTGVPAYYELQVLHYMLVGGYEKGYVAVLIGNEKFLWYEVNRDEEMIEYLKKIETEFWENHIEKNVLPSPDGSSDYNEELKKRYSFTDSESIDITSSDEKLDRLNELKEMSKDIETKIKKLEQEIKLEIGEHEQGIGSRYKVSWKPQSRNSIDTKKLKEEQLDIYNQYLTSTETRVFRITKLGE